MDITGKLHKVFDIQEIGTTKFKKREFILLDDENAEYPQYISFQLIKDKCSLIDGFTEGTELKVYFNLNGREWTNPEGKTVYFNSLVAWKIEGKKNEVKEEKPPVTPSQQELTGDDMPF